MVMLPRSVRISNLCLNELVSSQNAISKMENAVSVKKKLFIAKQMSETRSDHIS